MGPPRTVGFKGSEFTAVVPRDAPVHTKYTMGLAIAEMVGLDPDGLIRVDDAPAAGAAPRPHFERMSCGRMERILKAAGEGEPDDFRADFKSNLARDLEPFRPQRHKYGADGWWPEVPDRVWDYVLMTSVIGG